MLSDHRVAAMLATATVSAERPSPDRIELFNERIDKGRVVGQDTILEIALTLGLRAQPRAREVGRAEVRLPEFAT